jgi:hypothetical protein
MNMYRIRFNELRCGKSFVKTIFLVKFITVMYPYRHLHDPDQHT